MVLIDLIRKNLTACELQLFQIHSAYNGDLVVNVGLAVELGWDFIPRVENVEDNIGGNGNSLSTTGSISWLDEVRPVHALVLDDSEFSNGIQGYIGMGLLKGTRLEFDQQRFNISAYEG
jgi:hypothetical protein